MQSSDSKKLTLVYLQELFLEKTDSEHGITMPQILSYLEKKDIFVDRRTIYSDIKLLNYSGFEIVGKQGKNDYKYYHPSRLFNTNELKFLIDSVAASKFLTEKKSNELIKKIKSLGSSFDNDVLNRGILVNKRIKNMNDKVLKNLDAIYFAITNNSQISFQYLRWNRDRTLQCLQDGNLFYASPFAITLHDDYYYLISFDSREEKLKHYRLDKMQSIKLTYESREGLETFRTFDIADYSRKTFNMYGGKEESVSLEIPNILAGVFFDRFGEAVHIRPNFDNPKTCFARISVQVSPQFFAWILGLGKNVHIISPESVKEEYANTLRNALKYHDIP